MRLPWGHRGHGGDHGNEEPAKRACHFHKHAVQCGEAPALRRPRASLSWRADDRSCRRADRAADDDLVQVAAADEATERRADRPADHDLFGSISAGLLAGLHRARLHDCRGEGERLPVETDAIERQARCGNLQADRPFCRGDRARRIDTTRNRIVVLDVDSGGTVIAAALGSKARRAGDPSGVCATLQ